VRIKILVFIHCFKKGKLEWGDYALNESDQNVDGVAIYTNGSTHPPWADSIEALSTAEVLLAADVIYDVNANPALVAAVSKFLSQNRNFDTSKVGKERVAIFATTFRIKNIFALFEKELAAQNIICDYDSSLGDLPNLLPCYWNQPRSDIRVCSMRIQQ